MDWHIHETSRYLLRALTLTAQLGKVSSPHSNGKYSHVYWLPISCSQAHGRALLIWTKPHSVRCRSLARKVSTPLLRWFEKLSVHGSYAPYKYALSNFVTIACGMKEQLDPTVYTILTARSKIPGVSLSEFAAFTPKWLNTQNTFRPPVRQVSFLSTKRKPAV
jgi:hypothetical protein